MSEGLSRVAESEQIARCASPLLLAPLAAALFPLDPILSGMVGAGLGVEALCQYLCLSHDALDEAVARLCLPTPHHRPLRKSGPHGWKLSEIHFLIPLRVTGVHPDSIAEFLRKTPGAVRTKARRLGLPAPRRSEPGPSARRRSALRRIAPADVPDYLRGLASPHPRPREAPAPTGPVRFDVNRHVSELLPEDPRATEDALSSAAVAPASEEDVPPAPAEVEALEPAVTPDPEVGPASVPQLLAVECQGPVPSLADSAAAQAQTAPPGNALPADPQLSNISWIGTCASIVTNEAAVTALTLRYFGGQNWKYIARDAGLTLGSLRSILYRIEIPRDHKRTKFGQSYDARCAHANMAVSGLVLMRDSDQSERPEESRRLFWRFKKDKGITRSRAARFRDGQLGEYDKYRGNKINLLTRQDLDDAAAAWLELGEPPGPLSPSRSPDAASRFIDLTGAVLHAKRVIRHHPPSVRSGFPGCAGDQMPWTHPGNGGASGPVAHP